MKKLIAFLLAAVMLFSMAACGSSEPASSGDVSGAASSGNNSAAQAPQDEPEPEAEPTPEPEPEPAFQTVQLGETITKDYVEITPVETGSGEKITEGNSSLKPSNDSNLFFWLKATLMNTAGEGFSLWDSVMPVKLIFDDKYTYEGSVWNFGSSTMDPLVENSIYLYAEVPPTLMESYEAVTIRFGFNENFADYDYAANDYEFALENFDNLYELTCSRDGGSEPSAQPEESSGEASVSNDWAISYYVDNFNQPTDEGYVYNTSHWVGSFSNSATTDSLLYVDVVVDADYVAIFLYEYGKNTVKNSSVNYVDEYNITMRDNDGNDHELTATEYCGGDRLLIDDQYKDLVLEALQGEGSISFYIVKADRATTTYLFTLRASNFGAKYQELIG